ncbi:hypothetical protein T07_439 [Trichinella nelsoni]|uniref:Uncharacterized protein n=1 Tax=Trichinella nelsoni TaxID=6336 RepID=A0A0V0SH89_9BILA|nr:hypothetical protein T07_439 [Trichinella nelsoni]
MFFNLQRRKKNIQKFYSNELPEFPARCESSDPDDDQINNPWNVHVNISRHDEFYEEAKMIKLVQVSSIFKLFMQQIHSKQYNTLQYNLNICSEPIKQTKQINGSHVTFEM